MDSSFFGFFGGLCRFGASTGFVLLFCWCLCRLCDSDFTKHWQASTKNTQKKQTTRCTKHRQAPKKTKNNPATTPQKWTHSSWICFSFLSFWGPVQVWCNLVFCFLFWCLCRLGDSDFTKHWQAPIKKNKTKPLDAPNIGRHQKKTQCPTTTQKWTHRSWIFSFFACAGLVTLTSQNIDRQQQKKKH